VLGPLLNRSGLSIKNGVLLQWTTRARSGGPPLAPISGDYPSVFAFLQMQLGTLVTRKFRIVWDSLSLPTTSDI
jgi:hypothetical protein